MGQARGRNNPDAALAAIEILIDFRDDVSDARAVGRNLGVADALDRRQVVEGHRSFCLSERCETQERGPKESQSGLERRFHKSPPVFLKMSSARLRDYSIRHNNSAPVAALLHPQKSEGFGHVVVVAVGRLPGDAFAVGGRVLASVEIDAQFLAWLGPTMMVHV